MAVHSLHLGEQLTNARAVVGDQMAAMSQYLEPGFGEVADKAALGLLAQRLQTQAMVLSFSDVFILMGSVFVAALLLMPWVRKVGGHGAPAH